MKGVVYCPTLIGRDEERGLLIRSLEEAGRGRGSVTLILGEAGIGKSRLVREVTEEARQRYVAVLAGRAVQGRSPVPFRPLAQALFSYLRSAGLPDEPELEPFLPALGRLVPEWRREDASSMDGSTVILGEAILRLLRVVGRETGCLLTLEDLHWADPETLTVVDYLSDNLASEPVVCVGTVRTGETSAAVGLARTLQARRGAHILELSPLSGRDVERMALACLATQAVPEAVAAVLETYADGLPFLVEELLATMSARWLREPDERAGEPPGRPTVPVTFAQTVGERLSAFDEVTLSVVRAAAVLGRYFDWSLLPAVTGLDNNLVLDCLRRAVDAQLILVDRAAGGTSFRFRHALTRDAVLQDMLPPERAAIAGCALSSVEARHPELPDPWCELAADLAEAAGDRRRAAGLLLEAGRRALAQGALATAEASLDRAALVGHGDSPLTLDIDETLLAILTLAGKIDRAFEVGERLSAALSRVDAPPERRAQVQLLLAQVAATAARWAAAEEQLEEARRLAGAGPHGPLRARLDALAAHVAIGDNRPDQAAALAREALAGAERLGLPEIACEALEVIGRCARLHGLEEAEAAFDRARAIAEERGLTVWRIRALLELGTIDLLRGAPVDRLKQTLELAMSTGALATATVVQLQVAAALTVRFDLEAAREAATRTIDMARRFRLDPVRGVALDLVAETYYPVGRYQEAGRALDEASSVAGADPDVAACLLGTRGALALGQERRDVAQHHLDSAMSIVRQAPAASPHPYRGVYALLCAVTGRDGEAACAELRASGATAAHWNAGLLGYADAALLGRAGRKAEADAAFARGEMGLSLMPWYFHLARRLVGEAAIADGWGDPASWLLEAAVFFESLANDRVTGACRSLLRRAGVPVPRKGRGEAEVPARLRTLGVTSREMDVLTLLAEGLSNREIGARLYLSPRTVERHVENLAGKVGVAGRSQLVAFAARIAST